MNRGEEGQSPTLFLMVIVGIVFDLVVSIVIAVFAINASHATTAADRAYSKSTANAVALHQTCLSGNEFRVENLQLWQAIIHLIPATTPRGIAFDRTVLQLAGKAFTPRACPA